MTHSHSDPASLFPQLRNEGVTTSSLRCHRNGTRSVCPQELRVPWGWEAHPSAVGGERPPCPVLPVPVGGKKAGREKQVRVQYEAHHPVHTPQARGHPGASPRLTHCCLCVSAAPSDKVRAARSSSCFCNLCLRATSRGRCVWGSTRPCRRRITSAAGPAPPSSPCYAPPPLSQNSPLALPTTSFLTTTLPPVSSGYLQLQVDLNGVTE